MTILAFTKAIKYVGTQTRDPYVLLNIKYDDMAV